MKAKAGKEIATGSVAVVEKWNDNETMAETESEIVNARGQKDADKTISVKPDVHQGKNLRSVVIKGVKLVRGQTLISKYSSSSVT